MSSIDLARRLAEAGELDDSARVLNALLEVDPKNAGLLVTSSYVQWKAKRHGIAYHLAKRAVDIAPHEPAAWQNLGCACDDLWLTDESEQAYKMVLRLDSKPFQKAMAYSNLAALYVNTGRFKEAEPMARECLKLSPDSPKGEANLGFSLLGQRKWGGWKHYSRSLGIGGRVKVKYLDEPDWDGSPGKSVALYGEQGLGDEISFASMIPDAQKDCKKLIVECDPKLTNLFKRSFPGVKVYGTRKAKASDGVKWDEEDWKFDASLASGELGQFYRMSDESFTAEAFLKADPERRLMWRSLFDSKKKPAIGIAWTGGVPWTGQRYRTLNLKQLESLLKAVDAHWVSLQYRDASKEIVGTEVTQYGFATLTNDYDDTAALVAELDLVISIQTAVVHLAGALGKECWVFLPKYSQWRYGESGDRTPWYKSVEVVRQRSLNDWHGPIGEVVGRLRRRFG